MKDIVKQLKIYVGDDTARSMCSQGTLSVKATVSNYAQPGMSRYVYIDWRDARHDMPGAGQTILYITQAGTFHLLTVPSAAVVSLAHWRRLVDVAHIRQWMDTLDLI